VFVNDDGPYTGNTYRPGVSFGRRPGGGCRMIGGSAPGSGGFRAAPFDAFFGFGRGAGVVAGVGAGAGAVTAASA
jgi:hypothetical protein